MRSIIHALLGDPVSTPVRLARYAFLVVAIAWLLVPLGVDMNWDLKNYHFYAPYAMLNDRLMQDIGPAQMQGYFNPLLDVPFYFAVAWFNATPEFITFLLGLQFSLVVVLLMALARQFFPVVHGAPVRQNITIHAQRWAAVAIGVTGAATWSVVATTTGDLAITAFLLASLLTGVYFIRSERNAGLLMILTGVFAGAMAGLKLSYAPHALGIGMAVTMLAIDRRISLRQYLLSGAGAVGAFLVLAGPWMIKLGVAFGNPLYPLWNHVFHSPWAMEYDYVDRRFIPKDFGTALTYPFTWTNPLEKTPAAELPLIDWRVSLTMLLAATMIAGVALQKGLRSIRERKLTAPRFPVSNVWSFLAVYLIVAYAAWAYLYGIHRYLIPFEFVCGLAIAGAAGRIAAPTMRPAVLLLVSLAVVLTTKGPSYGRLPYGDVYLGLEPMPVLPDNSTVFILGGQAVSYAIPFIRPESVRYIGLDGAYIYSHDDNKQTQRTKELLANPPGPVFELRIEGEKRTSVLLEAAGYVTDPTNCQRFEGSLGDKFEICRMTSQGQPSPAPPA